MSRRFVTLMARWPRDANKSELRDLSALLAKRAADLDANVVRLNRPDAQAQAGMSQAELDRQHQALEDIINDRHKKDFPLQRFAGDKATALLGMDRESVRARAVA